LNALSVIGTDGVQVTKTIESTGSNFAITFISNAYDVPLLGTTDTHSKVSETVKGVSEVQLLTMTADVSVVQEQQQLILEAYNNATSGSITVKFNGKSTSELTYPSLNFVNDLEDALNSIVDEDKGQGRLAVSVRQSEHTQTPLRNSKCFCT
jgi:hypothetical protein